MNTNNARWHPWHVSYCRHIFVLIIKTYLMRYSYTQHTDAFLWGKTTCTRELHNRSMPPYTIYVTLSSREHHQHIWIFFAYSMLLSLCDVNTGTASLNFEFESPHFIAAPKLIAASGTNNRHHKQQQHLRIFCKPNWTISLRCHRRNACFN